MVTLNNKILKGKSKSGDFVLRSQMLATEQGFENVSLRWFDKTTELSKAVETAAEVEANSETLVRDLNEILPLRRHSRSPRSRRYRLAQT